MSKPEDFDRLLHGRTMEQITVTFKTEVNENDSDNKNYIVRDKESGELLFVVWHYFRMGDYYCADYVDRHWCKLLGRWSEWAEKIYNKVDEIYKKSLDIIKHTQNINAKDVHTNTLLIEAVKTGNVEIVESLIKKGANLDSCNKERDTALHVAIKQRLTKTAKMLIEHGTNLFLQNKEGDTALTLAIKASNYEIAYLIAQKIEQDNKNLQEKIKELKVKTKAHKNVKNAVNPPYRSTPAQRLLRLRKIKGKNR